MPERTNLVGDDIKMENSTPIKQTLEGIPWKVGSCADGWRWDENWPVGLGSASPSARWVPSQTFMHIQCQDVRTKLKREMQTVLFISAKAAVRLHEAAKHLTANFQPVRDQPAKLSWRHLWVWQAGTSLFSRSSPINWSDAPISERVYLGRRAGRGIWQTPTVRLYFTAQISTCHLLSRRVSLEGAPALCCCKVREEARHPRPT